MSARGIRQLATVVTSVSLSEPKGIQVSQIRDASVLVASPIVTCSAPPQIRTLSGGWDGGVGVQWTPNPLAQNGVDHSSLKTICKTLPERMKCAC